ncbi:MAG: hypothetical protein JSW05_00340 [Candidatus Thorarchaeota archaeon]|nr:MAG: hypothetical protein JSW05_00340 [Candidatus Thorarchaeota archaeon]
MGGRYWVHTLSISALPGCEYHPQDIKAVLHPIDYVVFCGMTKADVRKTYITYYISCVYQLIVLLNPRYNFKTLSADLRECIDFLHFNTRRRGERMRDLYNVKGGENVMSLSKRMSVGLLGIIFLVALVSAIPVEANKPHRWYADMSYTGEPSWTGVIETEDGKTGAFYWDNEDFYVLGPEQKPSVQKFWGVWGIDWDGDGLDDIHGTHYGSFTYAILQFTVNGRVTDASGAWSYMDGWKIHTVGNVNWETFHMEGYVQFN